MPRRAPMYTGSPNCALRRFPLAGCTWARPRLRRSDDESAISASARNEEPFLANDLRICNGTAIRARMPRFHSLAVAVHRSFESVRFSSVRYRRANSAVSPGCSVNSRSLFHLQFATPRARATLFGPFSTRIATPPSVGMALWGYAHS